MTLSLYLLVFLAPLVLPSPKAMLSLANASRLGVRTSMPGLLGAVLSDVFLVAAIATGLATLLLASDVVFSAVKWIGVAFLVVLGVQFLRSKGVSVPEPGRATLFLRSFLAVVTHPKSYFFLLVLLPQFFISDDASQALRWGIAVVVLAVLDAAVLLAYAMVGVLVGRLVGGKGVLWIDRLCGAALLVFAASLAFFQRPGGFS